jgi:hypothetical protein
MLRYCIVFSDYMYICTVFPFLLVMTVSTSLYFVWIQGNKCICMYVCMYVRVCNRVGVMAITSNMYIVEVVTLWKRRLNLGVGLIFLVC